MDIEFFDTAINQTLEALQPVSQNIHQNINKQHSYAMDQIRKGVHASILAFIASFAIGTVASILLTRERQQLKEMSTTDALTGLYNRRFIDLKLEKESRKSQNLKKPAFSLMLIDIDHFKKANDTYGHKAGDHVLYCLANLLRKQIRFSDFAGRFGGEEFAVILSSPSKERTHSLAESIRQEIDNILFNVDGDKKIHISVSIGIALFPGDADSENNIFVAADKALYAAKKNGRNRVIAFEDISNKNIITN